MEEANSANMRDFNLYALNKQGISYNSIGAHIYFRFCATIFKYPIYHFENKMEESILTDGFCTEEQTKWGQHIMTCEADHASLLGMHSQSVAEICAKVAIEL